ncbi:NTP transferase domain-containing protein [Porphyrobacter algicida]|uniref:NTP transferase domain-containing protein n=1 Tax=Qipengyuania algicida TaxID=1836209 RepID=A0A845AGV7_9SPHN|nr:sugar phosphate nucleotidyltransferase [Qipengyuania algicida]MXP28181.1 NTP transferase domain-containing protein [Qipengyuania algicida]
MARIYPVVLCGGSGTRLWPRSRKARPKPFLPLIGPRTLFQQSLDRVADPNLFATPTIVAGKAHIALVEEQAQSSGDARLIVEPAAKNTAPAIALAAHALPPDAIMLVCPSDHYIADEAAFLAGVEKASELADQDFMVAFGIEPTRPDTGYGYIRKGAQLGPGFRVDRFVEKPDEETARGFLASGDFVWNGGIFAFRAGAFLAELAAHRPEMAELVLQSFGEAERRGWQIHPAANPFAGIAGESVDYAVMEHTDRAAVVAADMGWSDIGNWEALMDARGCDKDGNHALGSADFSGCRNVMVDTDGVRVSVVGLEDVIVVVDGDEVLVTSRAGAQSVGKLPGAAQQ